MRAFLFCVELRPIVSGTIKCDFPAQPPKMIHNGLFAEGADRSFAHSAIHALLSSAWRTSAANTAPDRFLRAGVAGPAAPSDLQKVLFAVKVGLEALEI